MGELQRKRNEEEMAMRTEASESNRAHEEVVTSLRKSVIEEKECNEMLRSQKEHEAGIWKRKLTELEERRSEEVRTMNPDPIHTEASHV